MFKILEHLHDAYKILTISSLNPLLSLDKPKIILSLNEFSNLRLTFYEESQPKILISGIILKTFTHGDITFEPEKLSLLAPKLSSLSSYYSS